MIINKKVTVLMPVYNGERYLNEAIDSILNQTYKDFDLLIINDGSSDKSEEVILNYNDNRIKYIKNQSNLGLVKTLNLGFDMITGEFIARMDQDDISLPNRLQMQVNYMNRNKSIAVLGASIESFCSNGTKKKHYMETNSLKIKTYLLFYCPVMHPTVFIRNSILKNEQYRYNTNHVAVEDVGLWQVISFKYQLINLKKVLLNYRVHETNMTKSAEKDTYNRDLNHIKVYRQGLENFNLHFNNEQYMALRYFLTGRLENTEELLNQISLVLLELQSKVSFLDRKTYNKIMNYNFRTFCLNNNLRYKDLITIYCTYFTNTFDFRMLEKIKFLIKKFITH